VEEHNTWVINHRQKAVLILNSLFQFRSKVPNIAKHSLCCRTTTKL